MLSIFTLCLYQQLLDSGLFFAGLCAYKPTNEEKARGRSETVEDLQTSECETKFTDLELSSNRNSILPGEMDDFYIDNTFDNPAFIK